MSSDCSPDAGAADFNPVGLASRMNTFIEKQIPVMYRLGIRIVDLQEGSVAGVAPLAGNANHLGTMYAGTLFGLAEVLGGGVVFANFDLRRFTATVKDVQIRYRRPAATDVRAQASLGTATIARIKREADACGKSEFALDAQLIDTTGVLVATSRGTYQIRSCTTTSNGNR